MIAPEEIPDSWFNTGCVAGSEGHADKGAELTAIRSTAAVVLTVFGVMMAEMAYGQMPGGQRQSTGSSHQGIPAKAQAPEPAASTSVLGTVQYRLDLLEEDLRLRPEQNIAWVAYRTRVIKLAEDMQRAPRLAMGGDLTAPKRLDRLADIARDRLTAIEDIVDAGNALYALLTPEQKATADRRMAAPVMALAGVEPNSAHDRSLGPPKNP